MTEVSLNKFLFTHTHTHTLLLIIQQHNERGESARVVLGDLFSRTRYSAMRASLLTTLTASVTAVRAG